VWRMHRSAPAWADGEVGASEGGVVWDVEIVVGWRSIVNDNIILNDWVVGLMLG